MACLYLPDTKLVNMGSLTMLQHIDPTVHKDLLIVNSRPSRARPVISLRAACFVRPHQGPCLFRPSCSYAPSNLNTTEVLMVHVPLVL